MKKIKLISSLAGITCLVPSIIAVTSCKGGSTQQEYTINLYSSEGVNFVGDSTLKVTKGTKLKDLKLPEIKILPGAEGFGWIENSSKLFIDLDLDVEITQDLSFTFIARTGFNATTLKMYDKDRVSSLIDFPFVKGLPYKSLKSYYGEFKPQMDYRYQFNGWKDKNDNLITDETILNQEEIRVYADCTWAGATIQFSHNRYAQLKSGYVEPDPIPIEEDTTWGALRTKITVPEYEVAEGGKIPETKTGYGWYDQITGEQIQDTTVISKYQDFRPFYIIPPEGDVMNALLFIKKQNLDGTYTETNTTITTVKGITLYEFLVDIGYKKDNNVMFNSYKWYKDDALTEEISLFDQLTTADETLHLYNVYKINDFCLNTTSWKTIAEETAKGLDSLKKAYGVTSFVGFERKIEVYNREYTVRVIGENHDDYADGKGKAPLTYELKEVITDDAGNPLTTCANWTDAGFFPKENLLSVLNQESGTVCWYENGSTTASKNYNQSCIVALSYLDSKGVSLASYIKPVKKLVNKKSTHPDEPIVTSYSGKLFPLSTRECGTTYQGWGAAYPCECGDPYQYYKTHNKSSDRVKYTRYISDMYEVKPAKYWLGQPGMLFEPPRGEYTGEVYNVDQQIAINLSGDTESIKCRTTNQYGVSFAFCL